jgi:hypothetical protein
MSKVGLDSEIGISKSKFFIDGLYRDTLPLILFGAKSVGNTITTLFVFVIRASELNHVHFEHVSFHHQI